MGYLKLKVQEIEKLILQLQKIQEQKMKTNNAYVDEIHKNFKVKKQIEAYESESIMDQTISQEKESTWIDINESMNEFGPSIEIIFE